MSFLVDTNSKIIAREKVLLLFSEKSEINFFIERSEELRFEGSLKEAEILSNYVLEKIDPSSSEYGFVLNHTARILHEQKNYKAASEYLKRVLKYLNTHVSQKHPDYLVAIKNYALILYTQGKHEEAESYFEQLLGYTQEMMGRFHPQYTINMELLALTILKQKRFHEAESLLRKVVRLKKRDFGEYHPEYISSLNYQAKALYNKGDLPEVRKVYNEILSKLSSVHEEPNSDEVEIMKDLGVVLSDMGKFAEAEDILYLALKKQQILSGKNHPRYILILNFLGMVQSSQNRHDHAEKRVSEAYSILQKDFNSVILQNRVLFNSYMMTLNNLASIFIKLGKQEEAIRHMEQISKIKKSSKYQFEEGFVRSQIGLGLTLQEYGNHSLGREILLEAREMGEAVLGENHHVLAETSKKAA